MKKYFGGMYILIDLFEDFYLFDYIENSSSTQNPINPSFLLSSTIPTLVRFCCGFKEGLEDHLCLDCLTSMDHLK